MRLENEIFMKKAKDDGSIVGNPVIVKSESDKSEGLLFNHKEHGDIVLSTMTGKVRIFRTEEALLKVANKLSFIPVERENMLVKTVACFSDLV